VRIYRSGDSEKDRIRVQEEHIQIVDAVVAGDAIRAREIMQRHVVDSLGRRAISVLSTN
jgi:DNA-binding FadR family transcriptional regulator